jgi:hypothetical protein
MKEILTTSLFIFLFSTFGNAQMPVSELSKKTHLQQLKQGVLLVQLPNSDKKIKILRDQGSEKRAKQEEKEVNKIRDQIIQGFKEEWNYSEILFFEAKNSKEVFNKNPEFLLDSNLKSINKFPDFEHIYSVRYGPGNPNGEVYRYNGVGFQIRYIKDGELQTIKYDTFFHAARIRFLFRNLFRRNINKIKTQIDEFNFKLNNVKN